MIIAFNISYIILVTEYCLCDYISSSARISYILKYAYLCQWRDMILVHPYNT